MQSHQDTALSPWVPLLDQERTQAVLRSLAEVAKVLRHPDEKNQHGQADNEFAAQPFSLGSGAAGVSVFLAYLEKSGLFPGAGQAAFEQMNRAIDAVAQQYTAPALYSGFTGVGWAAEHVTKLLGESSEDLNSDLDNAVEQYVGLSPWKNDYDLISGLVGLGVYCLERVGSADRALELIVERLYETAESADDAVTWFTPPSLLIPMQTERYP